LNNEIKSKKLLASMCKKKTVVSNNNLDILSSIWILSCNDENPQITYQGIKYRLGLSENFDINNLVSNHAELFRKRTTPKQLTTWKNEMMDGKHLPSWIKDIESDSERKKTIDKLTVHDVFRNQFRAEANSPRSNIEIIKWGLEHIDRLRRTEFEKKQERTRIFTTVWLPILTTLVGVTAVISSFYVQFTSNKNQVELKHYEVDMRPKQVGYSDFMKFTTQAFYSSTQHDKEQLVQNLDKIESSFYSLDPFLNEYDRNRIWDQYQQYTGLCYAVLQSDSLKRSKKSLDSYIWYRNFFRENLYRILFTSQQEAIDQKLPHTQNHSR
jgi:hypothetical protein